MGSQEIRPGLLFAGKYRVRAVLGRARGVLAEAVHEEVDQRVALQVLLPEEHDESEMERFRREARALAKLESEHAARILDVGTEPDGSCYLVRQFLEGDDLASWAKSRGKVPVDEAVLLTLQAAEAVAEAHGLGIVLRELNPAHLFVTRRVGGGLAVKIIDFGTAKLVRDPRLLDDITATGVLGLTPYASPEMVRRSSVIDQRTDVWSLGVILYELLAGRPPFSGDDSELMLQIMKERAPPIAAVRGDVPQKLDDILGWAMAKDLVERFRDVHAFAHALRPFAPPEGQLTVDRIGQIAKQAKRRKQAAQEDALKERLAQSGEGAPARRSDRPAAPRSESTAPSPPKPRIDDEESVTRHQPLRAPRALETPSPARAAVAPAAEPAPRPSPPPPKPVTKSGRPAPVFAGAAADIDMELHSAPTSTDAPAIPSAPRVPSFDATAAVAPVAASARTASRAAPAPPARGTDTARAAPPTPAGSTSIARATRATPPAGTAVTGPAAPATLGRPRSDPPAAVPASHPPPRTASYRPPPPSHLPPLARPQQPPNPLILIAAAVVCATVPAVLAILLLGRKSPPPAGLATASAQQAVVEPPLPPPIVEPPPAAPPLTAEPSAAAPAASTPAERRPPRSRPGESPAPAKGADEPGTLVAVAVGGNCAFSVNGAVKGSGTTVKVTLPPGSYTVTCKPATGGAKSRSVVIVSGGTAMATFKLP